jgi:hypothetical protein
MSDDDDWESAGALRAKALFASRHFAQASPEVRPLFQHLRNVLEKTKEAPNRFAVQLHY